jgi:CBS domain-containing protein
MFTQKVLDARVAGTQFESPRHPRVEPLTVNNVLRQTPSRVHCVNVNATSLDALKLMAEHDIGAVLVSDGGRVVGTFSERDYARGSIQTIGSPRDMQLREVMTSCDIVANLTDTVQACLSLMMENHLRYLPVQDGDNPIALLTFDDLLREKVAYLERVFKENEIDQQIVFLRGTYSC